MLNYCEAWPNRIEGSNNIFVDGTGVVPFLRSSAAFQKIVIMNEEYPASKEIGHTTNQGSSDCIVFKDQVDQFGKADSAAADALPEMSKEDLLASMTTVISMRRLWNLKLSFSTISPSKGSPIRTASINSIPR